MTQLHVDVAAMHRNIRVAKDYDRYAAVQREISDRLLDRLQYINIAPKRIVDLGCGTGYMTEKLSQKYPKAVIIAVDGNATKLAKLQNKALSNVEMLQHDVDSLPIDDQSVDLIISSGLLHWLNDISHCLSECRRMLMPKGLLLFSTLGPNTLQELRKSIHSVNNNNCVHDFCDMHDIGDGLLSLQFSDPVMDSEVLTFLYETVDELLQDLKQTGSQNARIDRSRGLLTQNKLQKIKEHYHQQFLDDGQYPATFEVIYGHAWGPVKSVQQVSDDGSEVYVAVPSIHS